MIKVNNHIIELKTFPDGTSSFKFGVPNNFTKNHFNITWNYEGEHECMALWHLVLHIRDKSEIVPKITLNIPYFPNARMDRVKYGEDVFTLKWFAEFINTLNFERVYILDPHSNVTPALINRVSVINPVDYILNTIDTIKTAEPNLIYCFPDEGSCKRYSDYVDNEYVFCIKHRKWNKDNSEIQSLELNNPEKVTGKSVLIIDDICSKGGTFTRTAKALKDAGAEKIYLYVTHCENNIFNGTVLSDGLIEHVFTTNSIFTGEHEKITIV